ncbi:MAG: hypothetical protein WBK77_06045 [Alphaproteobacteria bacterium]
MSDVSVEVRARQAVEKILLGVAAGGLQLEFKRSQSPNDRASIFSNGLFSSKALTFCFEAAAEVVNNDPETFTVFQKEKIAEEAVFSAIENLGYVERRFPIPLFLLKTPN